MGSIDDTNGYLNTTQRSYAIIRQRAEQAAEKPAADPRGRLYERGRRKGLAEALEILRSLDPDVDPGDIGEVYDPKGEGAESGWSPR